MFSNTPKIVKLSLLLIKALDLKNALRLIQDIVYLWREFYIKVKITPVIEKYRVSFYYKDKQILSTNMTDLNDFIKVSDELKGARLNYDRDN